MNLVVMTGHLATEPEERITQSGKSVTSFRLAVSRGKNREADFFSVSAWEKKGEFIRRYWHKGDGIEIRGKLASNVYERDGVKRYDTNIIVDESFFPVGRSSKRIDPDGEPGSSFDEMGEEDGELPWQ